MRLTKRNLIKTAAVGSALLGAVAVAAPASANSFGPTDYGTYGAQSYIYIGPSSGRGPSHFFKVYQGQTKCVSLARAYEDSRYYYQVGGHEPVDFYS